MPATGWVSLSEQGNANIAAGATVNLISFAYAVTAVNTPRVRLIWTTEPRRVQFGGTVGVALRLTKPDTTPAFYVIDEYPVTWEFERPFPREAQGTVTPQIPCSAYFWRLPPGLLVSIYLEYL